MTLTLRRATLNVRAIIDTDTYAGKNKIREEKIKMGTSFQYSKTLASEGAILLTLGPIPYVGWILGIIGIVLLLRGLKEFAGYYQDSTIYSNALTGVKYYIVALIAIGVAGAGVFVSVASGALIEGITGFGFVGLTAGIIVALAGMVVAFVFYILAASNLKKTLRTLAQKTGEQSFDSAATLLWIGSILTIIGVGLLLIFIAWIMVVIGFFTIRPPQQQYAYQPYGNAPPYTQPPTGPTQA